MGVLDVYPRDPVEGGGDVKVVVVVRMNGEHTIGVISVIKRSGAALASRV